MSAIESLKFRQANTLLLSVTLLLSFTSLTLSQKSYGDADCNGPTLQSLRDSNAIMDNINTTSETVTGSVTFSSTPGPPQFQTSSIDPDTGDTYVIFKVRPGRQYYLGTLDIATNTVTNIVNTSDDQFYVSGMSFDCDGNLWIIDYETREMCTIDPSTGVISDNTDCFFATQQACNPNFEDCNEVIAYNYDDGLMYRISSLATGTVEPDLFVHSLDGSTEVKHDIHDPNSLCPQIVGAIEYIGNDIFMISCHSGIYLLDITNATNPTIVTFDNGGITGPNGPNGLIPTDTSGAVCTANCGTTEPSATPSVTPSVTPSTVPSLTPTINPSLTPTVNPSVTPSTVPSVAPTINPSVTPTINPSVTPTRNPSISPTLNPSVTPTLNPSISPTLNPSVTPSVTPTVDPTPVPTPRPTLVPSSVPTINPTQNPSQNPSVTPTQNPTSSPNNEPSISPSLNPTINPSVTPSANPSISPTTNEPSMSPSYNPTSVPTQTPITTQPTTASPTPSLPTSASPTNTPSVTPTHNPSVTPTNTPSVTPTVSPSNIPTLFPTLSPTNMPTISPTTNEPTLTPSASPVTNEPTIAPLTNTPTTAIPTISPVTDGPTQAPVTTTSQPTMAPVTNRPTTVQPTTAIPTTAMPTTDIPTLTPITGIPTTACTQCPYNVSIAGISDISLSSDCPTVSPTPVPTSHKIWKQRSADSDSSSVAKKKQNKVTDKAKKNRNKNRIDSRDSYSGSSDSDRRRLRKIIKSDSYSDSDSDSGESEEIKRCWSDGEPLIFVDDICDDNTKNGYYSYSDSSDSNEIDLKSDAFIAPLICVSYDVSAMVTDEYCGDINHIFLGLCESEDTDFDSSLLGIADIERLISADTFESGNNVLSARGFRNGNGDLGVLVTLEEQTIYEFNLCFESVAVTAQFNQTKYLLDIADGFLNFTNNTGENKLCHTPGLPCLNFFFGCEDDIIGPKESASKNNKLLSESRNCECEKGMTAITLAYNGPFADSIIGYYGQRKRVLCEFYDVSPGDTIKCTAKNTRNGIFAYHTNFAVSYAEDNLRNDRRRNLLQSSENGINGDCYGRVTTSCESQIIGDALRGCKQLSVVSHRDRTGALCDAQILAAETESGSNAFINGKYVSATPLSVLREFDPFIRWILIGIMAAFVILMCVSIYICFGDKCGKSEGVFEESSEDDAIATAIALTKQRTIDGSHKKETVSEEIISPTLCDLNYDSEDREYSNTFVEVSTE